MNFTRILGVVLAVLLSYAPSALSADLVSYQSDGWRYMRVFSSDPLHDQFYQVTFDDFAWPLGQGGFGSGGACDIQSSRHTAWYVNTDILLRRHFDADPAAPVTVHVAIDNDVAIFVNGTLVVVAVTEECAFLDKYNVLVPQALLLQGDNLLAVVAHDRGLEAYVDVRVEGQPAVGVEQEKVPRVFRVSQNYPNPFNPVCTIRYEIPKPGRVSLQVFDIVGKPVRTLVDAWREPGMFSEVWDGKADDGSALPSGIYFYSIKAGDFVATRKLVLLR